MDSPSRKTHWFNGSQYIWLSMLSWIMFAVVVPWGSPDAPAWQCFMLDLDLKPQWSGNSVCVWACVCVRGCVHVRGSEREKMTEMRQDEETFWSPTAPHMVRKCFLGNQLCKYWIMQMLHLNKSMCLGRKDFGVVFYLESGEERVRWGKRTKTRIRLESHWQTVCTVKLLIWLFN